MVSDSRQQDAVEVTFTAEGAAVLNDLINEAVRAGASHAYCSRSVVM